MAPPAIKIQRRAVGPDSAEMTRPEIAPTLYLEIVHVIKPPSERIAAIPLKPSERIIQSNPAFALPFFAALTSGHAKTIHADVISRGA